MQDLTTPRGINKQSPLAKTNKQRLQKIPVVEIVLIVKYHSNWTIFYLHMFIRIRKDFINILLSSEKTLSYHNTNERQDLTTMQNMTTFLFQGLSM